MFHVTNGIAIASNMHHWDVFVSAVARQRHRLPPECVCVCAVCGVAKCWRDSRVEGHRARSWTSFFEGSGTTSNNIAYVIRLYLIISRHCIAVTRGEMFWAIHVPIYCWSPVLFGTWRRLYCCSEKAITKD